MILFNNYYKIECMKKLLVVLPDNLVGKYILEGFAKGFELNKFRVVKKTLKEIIAGLEDFIPDVIFGYEYSFLENEKCKNVIQKSGCKNFSFYFAHEPKQNKALFEEIKKLNSKIFIPDKDFAKEYKNSFYLPLAASPRKYHTEFSGFKHTITFAGDPSHEACQKILTELIKVFKNKISIFSYKKAFQKSVDEIETKKLLDKDDLEIYSNCWKGFLKSEQELAEVYNSSKVNLNITTSTKSSLNYRVFEILASGGFLLTDEREDLSEFFEISKQLETYSNIEDLIDKINFYLKNLNIAQKIAQLGKFEVAKKHTFSVRAKKCAEIF